VTSDRVSAVVAGIFGSIRCVLPLLQPSEFLELKLSIFKNSLDLIGRFPLYLIPAVSLARLMQKKSRFWCVILLCGQQRDPLVRGAGYEPSSVFRWRAERPYRYRNRRTKP